MSDHIDFVEQVYENVKHPLNYVMNRVSNLTAYTYVTNPSSKEEGAAAIAWP